MTASADLSRIADDVARIPRGAMIAAAKATKKIALEEAPFASMQGKKKRAIRLRVRDKDLPARTGTARIRVYGTPTAPWVWVTDGTDPHEIRRRKKGPRKKMTVHHPGTAGRGTWKRVIARSLEDVPQIFADAVREAVRRG